MQLPISICPNHRGEYHLQWGPPLFPNRQCTSRLVLVSAYGYNFCFLEGSPVVKPLPSAAIIATIFLIPSLIYIYISSHFTADAAATAEEAAFFEIVKGTLYVSVMAVLIFGSSWKALSALRQKQIEARKMRDALLRAERGATAGLLAATVAHDVRNELAVLKSNNDFLKDQPGLEESTTEIVDDQDEAIERLLDLSDRLVDAGRAQADSAPEAIDVVDISSAVVKSLRAHSRLDECELIFNAEVDSGQLSGFPTMIYQALINLVFNAADAVSGDGCIELRICRDGDTIVVEAHDNGPGISNEQSSQLFEPFYTTKATGTGLGMISVRSCARAHNGDVEVESSPLGGACIRLLLHEADPKSHSFQHLGTETDDDRDGSLAK